MYDETVFSSTTTFSLWSSLFQLLDTLARERLSHLGLLSFDELSLLEPNPLEVRGARCEVHGVLRAGYELK
jgi:hypothetical protein